MDHSQHEHMDHSQHVEHDQHDNSNQGTTPVYSQAIHESHNHLAHSHQAFFNTALNVTVLFEKWTLDTRGSIFLACLCTCILAVGYQGTKWFRQYLHTNFSSKVHSIKSKEHLLQTLLYGAEFIVSYLLMLIVMTYNIWVFVVTILGLGLGYFLCGWHRPSRPQCADDCPNVVEQRSRDIKASRDQYDRNPSAQELMPLETDMCEGCNNDFSEAAVGYGEAAIEYSEAKETDILT